jgi:gliding motility-associated-like protein
MYKLFFLFVFSFLSQNILSQNIIVNDTYTAQQLIENVLVNSPCANVSNFSVNGGNFGTGQQSFGYFNSNSSGFPFTDGIVLSTSRAIATQGPNTSLLSQDATGWIGDADLEQALNISNTSNATSIEFDFIPLTSTISFDYIFASEEYHGTAACNYSDGFAFLLKVAGSSNQYQNLALIPNTNIPVKVTSVHPEVVGSCPAQNETYFGSYNSSSAPINFNGQTVIMTAKATVIPGTKYHIKLVIADETNPLYDSAIFLGGNSFAIGTDLGIDHLIATNNPVCQNQTLTLSTSEPGSNTYKWYKNGTLIPGATNSTYTVVDAGVYKVEIALNGTLCLATDEVIIGYSNLPTLYNQTLVNCDDDSDGITSFNLTKLNALITGGNSALNGVTYYENLLDAQSHTNPILNPNNYINTTTNQVFAAVSSIFGCYNYASINLVISNTSITPPNAILICDTDGIYDGFGSFDLNQDVSSLLLTGLPSGLIVSYYNSFNDAVSESNPLPNNFVNTIAFQQTIYARIVNGPDCYGIIPVQLKVSYFDPTLFQDETIYICDGNTVDLEVASGFNNYNWSTSATTNIITVSQSGNYSVSVTNNDNCQITKHFLVIDSGVATIDSIIINDFSQTDNSVQINVSGNGNYEYSLNGEQYQDSSIFLNVFPDIYTVSIRDKNGCGITTQQITVLDYPKYFTPNNDGINDIWYIKNLATIPNTKISIFDRFGKLIYIFNELQSGWNGKLNEKDMLATDYWFVINFENNKIVKGHFALKR